jgi:hypothetical protein
MCVEPKFRTAVLKNVSSDFAHVNQTERNQHYRILCVGRITSELTKATCFEKRVVGNRAAAGTKTLSETECSSEIQTGEACLG